MKSISIIAAALYAGLAAAQSLPDLNNLPPCGKLCITNMLAKAQSLGCSETDVSCLCKNKNFGYGVRDCSNAVCKPADATTVIAFGNSICAAYAASSGITTVTTTVGTATEIISTGTNSAGSLVTTTLTPATAPATGIAVILTLTTDGSTIVTTETVAASATNGSTVTTTNSEGSSVTSTVGVTGPPGGGIIVLTGTNSAGSTFVTTVTGTTNGTATGSATGGGLVTTTNSAGMTITSTKPASGTGSATTAGTSSTAGAAHIAGPALGGVAGLLALALL